MSPKQELIRVNFKIKKEQYSKIKEVAALRRISLTSLFVSALDLYLTDGKEKGSSDQYILSLAKKLTNLKVDVEIVGEMVSFFVLHYFCYTPEFPDSQRKALLIDARKRHAKFMGLLSKQMRAKESGLLHTISQPPITDKSEDFESE